MPPRDHRQPEPSEDLLEEKGAGKGVGKLVDRHLEAVAADLEALVVSAVELLEEEAAEIARRRCHSFGAAEEGVDDDPVGEATEELRLQHLRVRRRRV